MIIKFLKKCTAPKERWETHCECCGPEPAGWEDEIFIPGEEIDPDETFAAVDISGLEKNVDYEVLKYD
jgi:hypothetical protein